MTRDPSLTNTAAVGWGKVPAAAHCDPPSDGCRFCVLLPLPPPASNAKCNACGSYVSFTGLTSACGSTARFTARPPPASGASRAGGPHGPAAVARASHGGCDPMVQADLTGVALLPLRALRWPAAAASAVTQPGGAATAQPCIDDRWGAATSWAGPCTRCNSSRLCSCQWCLA